MERLTKNHVKKNGGYFMKCSEYCEREETMCLECERSDEIVDRLGEIEDILGDDYDLVRLKVLVESDRTKKANGKMNGRKNAWTDVCSINDYGDMIFHEMGQM